MLELDLVVGTWAKGNVKKLSMEECRRYDEEVLSIETPDLYRVIIADPDAPDSKELLAKRSYLRDIREVMYQRKRPYDN